MKCHGLQNAEAEYYTEEGGGGGETEAEAEAEGGGGQNNQIKHTESGHAVPLKSVDASSYIRN